MKQKNNPIQNIDRKSKYLIFFIIFLIGVLLIILNIFELLNNKLRIIYYIFTLPAFFLSGIFISDHDIRIVLFGDLISIIILVAYWFLISVILNKLYSKNTKYSYVVLIIFAFLIILSSSIYVYYSSISIDAMDGAKSDCLDINKYITIKSYECISGINNTIVINIESRNSNISSYVFILDGILKSIEEVNPYGKYTIDSGDKKSTYNLGIAPKLKNGHNCDIVYTEVINCPV